MKKSATLFFTFLQLTLCGSDIKEVIAQKKQELSLSQSESEKSRLFYELALAYAQDQELDLAFTHFLEALKRLPRADLASMDENEKSIFESALNDYVNRGGQDPAEAGKALLEVYGEIALQNKNYKSLNFLIATAYANTGQYLEFFEKFYQGYPYLSTSFLASKTVAILNLRLAHHGRAPKERQSFLDEAKRCLNLALDEYPQDPSLYKILLFLAKDEGDTKSVAGYINKIAEHHVRVARGDILLYVKEAVALCQYDLAQRLIDQAKCSYPYSRAVTTAQEFLNQHKR